MGNEYFDIRLRLTEKERADLQVVLELVLQVKLLQTFDSQHTDMKIPVDKLLENISVNRLEKRK